MDEAEKAIQNKDSPLLTDPESTRSSLDNDDAAAAAGVDKPPAFGEHYGQVAITNESLDTKLSITDDGRVNIKLCEKARRLSKMATFLDKQASRKIDFKPDYVGFTIEPHFVIGYGLDYAERYRNIPEIQVLSD